MNNNVSIVIITFNSSYIPKNVYGYVLNYIIEM